MNRSCGEATVVSEDHQDEVSATRMTRLLFFFLFCRFSSKLVIVATPLPYR